MIVNGVEMSKQEYKHLYKDWLNKVPKEELVKRYGLSYRKVKILVEYFFQEQEKQREQSRGW